jgi:hypothetical protein
MSYSRSFVITAETSWKCRGLPLSDRRRRQGAAGTMRSIRPVEPKSSLFRRLTFDGSANDGVLLVDVFRKRLSVSRVRIA